MSSTELSATLRLPASRWSRWRHQYALAAIGAVIVLLWIGVAMAAQALAPYAPNAVVLSARLLPPGAQHLLGTDELGRDVLSRLIFGARISLVTGVLVVTVGAVIGTLLGGIAAYAGGLLEEAIMRLTDLVLCFPPIILALAIAAPLAWRRVRAHRLAPAIVCILASAVVGIFAGYYGEIGRASCRERV